jgi:hypothetical protein
VFCRSYVSGNLRSPHVVIGDCRRLIVGPYRLFVRVNLIIDDDRFAGGSDDDLGFICKRLGLVFGWRTRAGRYRRVRRSRLDDFFFDD